MEALFTKEDVQWRSTTSHLISLALFPERWGTSKWILNNPGYGNDQLVAVYLGLSAFGFAIFSKFGG